MNDGQRDTPDFNRGEAQLVPATAAAPAVNPYRQLTPYPEVMGDAEPEFHFKVLEYWRIINKRKWLIISIVAACGVLGLVQVLMTTPLFTSSVRLQIERNAARIVEAGNLSQPVDSYDLEFLRTQFELLQSRALAERVASALKLGDDPDFVKPRSFSFIRALVGLAPAKVSESDRANLEDTAAGIVLANRTVRPISGSRLIDISCTDPVPARAQRIASAYAEAVIASNLDKRFQANAYAKSYLEDQVKQLKLRLEESEKVLLDFAQQEQIVVVTEKSNVAESNLAAAYATLGSLASDRIKNEQLWKQLELATAINLPQLLTNSVIDGLRAQRNKLVTEYQEKLETFQPSYPAMVQIDNKIKEIDRQLTAEVKTIKASFKAAYESSANQEEEMKRRIGTLKAEALDLQKRSIQYNILKREVDTNRSLYEGLLQRYKEIDVATGGLTNNVFVVDKADLPTSPSSPKVLRALMLSLALGFGAGLGGAFLLERFDTTIKSVEELERLTGLPTLGIIPMVKTENDLQAELNDPRSVIAEAYRSLCTSLQFSTESGLPKTIFITSAGPSEGKSTTAVAVASYFAKLGSRVLLVDADLRNASLHTKLGLNNSIGLSNCLTGACTPPEAFQTTSISTLAFMASGPLPPNAADLLGGSRLLSFLSVGLEVFDLIVIDGPPVLGLADAQLLSNAAIATIFVVRHGQSRSGAIRGALKALYYVRSPIIGTVLTSFDTKSASYGYGYGYGNGYGYGYGYGYGQHGKGDSPARTTVKAPDKELPQLANEPKAG